MEPKAQSSMNVSMPESMRSWIESVVAAESYGTASEYVRFLIREDQKRRAKEDVDARLLDALGGGPETELTPADWDEVRQAVRERIRPRKSA